MARIRVWAGNGTAHRKREFDFTVVLMPVTKDLPPQHKSQKRFRLKNPLETGYQVTVPLLPGVITYGRSGKEALEMAADAIRCHLDGLHKSGQEIPDETRAHTAKLHVALSA